MCFSLIKNDLNSFLLSIPSPEDSSKKIDIIVFPKSHSITVKIINNSPYIEYKGEFMARIHSVNNNSKYLNSDVLDEISESLNNYLTNILTEYLYKTSIDYKSDINGFGKYSLTNFLTIPEFEKYDWKNSYKDSVFNVKVESLVDSSILITET